MFFFFFKSGTDNSALLSVGSDVRGFELVCVWIIFCVDLSQPGRTNENTVDRTMDINIFLMSRKHDFFIQNLDVRQGKITFL